MISLTSSANELFKLWKSLLSSKGIKKEGLFLLSGEKLIQEYLLNTPLEKRQLSISAEIVPQGGQPLTQTMTKSMVYELSKSLFDELDEIGTHYNILVLKKPEIQNWDFSAKPQGLELICPLGDPANLGALIRSAEAFGVSKILLTEESANPFLPKAIKASAGSVLRVPLFKVPSISKLPENSLNNIVALDKGGANLSTYQWNKNTLLLVGEEGPGLRNFSGKNRVSIPMFKSTQTESLNAVVAASIAIYDYQLKTRN